MEESLRELKHRQTHQRLAEAAFELAVERGLDGFVIEDITSRAGYSRRTFANHFSGKEEAVAAAVVTEGIAGAIDGIAVPAAEEPLLAVLERIAHAQLDERMLERVFRLQELAHEHPSLLPHLVLTGEALRAHAAALLIDSRAAHDPLDATLLLHACYGTLAAMFVSDVQIRREDEPHREDALTVGQFLDAAFTRLRSGFDSPSPH